MISTRTVTGEWKSSQVLGFLIWCRQWTELMNGCSLWFYWMRLDRMIKLNLLTWWLSPDTVYQGSWESLVTHIQIHVHVVPASFTCTRHFVGVTASLSTALVSGRVDYCNSLLYIDRLQKVQNYLRRIPTRARPFTSPLENSKNYIGCPF